MSQPDLITVTDPRSPASEAYRTLRTNLEFSSLDHPLRSLLVTSPTDHADKSLTLANLAVIMAEGGRQVILVDGDLRRPVLHDLFGVENTVGLSDVIRQADSWAADPVSADLPLRESGIEGIKLLTSGQLPQNPSVLLGSSSMDRVIAHLSGQADLVLFDAPPVLAVTDAALVATRVDGTLLVVRAGGTRREHVQQAKELLARVNAHLVGAALTHASLDGSVSRYYK
jgi:capsular exopolysaccharide synthesis family protein